MSAEDRRATHTRRAFLAGAGVVGAAAATGLGLANAGKGSTPPLPDDIEASEFPPLPPASPPPLCTITSFFTADEAHTVDAIASRILPGTPDDPGAHEACVVTYIDQKLAEFADYAEPTYAEGPFPELHLPAVELERHGFQSSLTPQDAYRRGLAALDRHCQGRYGRPFVALSTEQQYGTLANLEDGQVDGFDEPSADGFFDLVRTDVIHGMFADPAYGGNAAFAGWELLGYPGAQRGYTPVELRTGHTDKRPTDLGHLHPTHPGTTEGGGEPVVQLPRPQVRS